MCGIAGYFGTKELEPASIPATLSLMRRRGPDFADHKRWRNPAGRNAYLLHSRLNIIDLDPRSNQPMQVGSRWIAYNGEIYNYLELRRELEAATLARASAPAFRTQSDTEVLLAGLSRHGPNFLQRCEGMWAFAAYDEEEGTLLLSRDRFGEKPLFLYREPGGLYFGSEVKFISALLGRGLPVNKAHLYRYLVNGYKSLYKGEETFFQGITELKPGRVLGLDPRGRESSRAYWTPAFAPAEGMSYAEAVAGAKERLIRSVELRLRADVPLAFCMSGGVDSNSLIAIAKRVFGYDVHGFSITNADPRYDERETVRASAKELAIRLTEVPTDTRDFLPRLRALVRAHDAPVYTASYYAHWRLMGEVAGQGYRISVSGTAADELFTGYYDHHLAYLYELRENPALLARARASWERRIKPLVRNPFLQDPSAFLKNPKQRNHIFLDAEIFSEYLGRPFSEPFRERRFTQSLLRNRMLNELFHEAIPVILHEDDHNAMHFSIENRSPFLDRSLFEFCYSIPSRHLIRDGRAKAVLRDALKGILPEPIRVNPRKVGFNVPILSYLDAKDPGVRRTLLADSPIYEHVRREKLEALISNDQLPNSESKFLFNFLCAKMFVEEF